MNPWENGDPGDDPPPERDPLGGLGSDLWLLAVAMMIAWLPLVGATGWPALPTLAGLLVAGMAASAARALRNNRRRRRRRAT